MLFRFKSSEKQLRASEVGALRKVCGLAIAEVQRRSALDLALLEIPVLSGEWPKSGTRVASLLAAIERGEVSLRVLYVDDVSDAPSIEEELTVVQARELLERLHEIALEQDMLQQLELGHIKSPREYVPPPEKEV